MSDQEQLAHAVALAFMSHGCSIARLEAESDMPVLAVGKAGYNIVVAITHSGEADTDSDRKWADSWDGLVVWCTGRGQAAAIADALAGGEFE